MKKEQFFKLSTKEVLITDLEDRDVFYFGGYTYILYAIGLGSCDCVRVLDGHSYDLPLNSLVQIFILKDG